MYVQAGGGEGAQDPELRLSFGIPRREYKARAHSWAGSNEDKLGCRFKVKYAGPHWERIYVCLFIQRKKYKENDLEAQPTVNARRKAKISLPNPLIL